MTRLDEFAFVVGELEAHQIEAAGAIFDGIRDGEHVHGLVGVFVRAAVVEPAEGRDFDEAIIGNPFEVVIEVRAVQIRVFELNAVFLAAVVAVGSHVERGLHADISLEREKDIEVIGVRARA